MAEGSEKNVEIKPVLNPDEFLVLYEEQVFE